MSDVLMLALGVLAGAFGAVGLVGVYDGYAPVGRVFVALGLIFLGCALVTFGTAS